MRAPVTTDEEDLIIATLEPMIGAFGNTLGRHVEFVLHDLRQPERSVVSIANGAVSGRQKGSPVIAAPHKDEALRTPPVADQAFRVMENYTTHTRDGRQLRSSTVIMYNATGKPYAAVCVNCDLSVYQAMQVMLAGLLNPPPVGEPVEEATPVSVDALMNEIVGDAVNLVGKPVAAMDKDDKMRAVEHMDERGLFLVKGSVEHAAFVLEVSRFTIYNYLEEIRVRTRARQRDS